MFPEYRDLIAELRQNDAYFARIFDEHNELDHKIINLEQNPATRSLEEIDQLKKQKLALKDRLYEVIKRVEAEREKS